MLYSFLVKYPLLIYKKGGDMKMSELIEHEITIRVADRQFEILENRAKKLGLSKEELIKRYITEAIDEEQQVSQEQRLAQILSVKGKYSSVLTSSDEFAQRKQEEIQTERRK
jgi:hypothetical protein